MKISLQDLREIGQAAYDVYDYLTDNSCSDPDCCGGPFISLEAYEEGLAVLEKFGIEYDRQRD